VRQAPAAAEGACGCRHHTPDTLWSENEVKKESKIRRHCQPEACSMDKQREEGRTEAYKEVGRHACSEWAAAVCTEI
jgi:hypothetical protein